MDLNKRKMTNHPPSPVRPLSNAHRTQQHTWQLYMSNQKLPATESSQKSSQKSSSGRNGEKMQNSQQSSVQGFIACNFMYKNNEIILPKHKSLTCPHLKYAIPVLRLKHLKKVQCRARKKIPENRNHSNNQRLKDLKLVSLVEIILRI